MRTCPQLRLQRVIILHLLRHHHQLVSCIVTSVALSMQLGLGSTVQCLSRSQQAPVYVAGLLQGTLVVSFTVSHLIKIHSPVPMVVLHSPAPAAAAAASLEAQCHSTLLCIVAATLTSINEAGRKIVLLTVL